MAAAYRGPNSKNGYLTKFMRSKAQSHPNTKSAPALDDCTNCDTPIAAPAKRNPGPSFLSESLKFCYFD